MRAEASAAAALTFDQAARVLDQPVWYEPWRADFPASAPYAGATDLQPPSGDALAERCARYGFPAAASRILVAHRASFDDPRIARLAAHVQWMTWERYAPRGYLRLGWPPPPREHPLFYAYAGLGLAARTEAAQQARGIPSEVTRATLWDLGQQVMLHERIHGEPGMPKGWWIVHHLASHLFRLGRLQFQRSRAGSDATPLEPDEPFLNVHIPEDGPLAPAACDASFRAASSFFGHLHYPQERARFFLCSSWLLDPVLREILPADSNIVRFQRRFELLPQEGPGASTVFEFVFDRPDLDRQKQPDLEGLPQRTRLERALVSHYRAGGRVGSGVGLIPIEGASEAPGRLD